MPLFLDFWWHLPWVSKPGWIPCLCAFLPVCTGFYRFTSGVTPANCTVVSMAAEPFQSTSIGGAWTHDQACDHNTLNHSAAVTLLLFRCFCHCKSAFLTERISSAISTQCNWFFPYTDGRGPPGLTGARRIVRPGTGCPAPGPSPRWDRRTSLFPARSQLPAAPWICRSLGPSPPPDRWMCRRRLSHRGQVWLEGKTSVVLRLHLCLHQHFSLTRKSSCGKRQESYRPRRNLSKCHPVPDGGCPHPVPDQGGTPSNSRPGGTPSSPGGGGTLVQSQEGTWGQWNY